MLAFVVGKLRAFKREHFPDIVLEVDSFLQRFDRACIARNWRIATAVEMLGNMTFLRKIAEKERHAQWLLPIKCPAEKSILGSGVWTSPTQSAAAEAGPSTRPNAPMSGLTSDNCVVVSATGGSRKHELMAGRLRLRKFQKEGTYYVPEVMRSDIAATGALLSYTGSSREWTLERFYEECFIPIATGEKPVSSANS